jgi:hypothetical protein
MKIKRVRVPLRFLKPALTHARLRKLLDYDPSTGTFTWLTDKGHCRAGSVAGSAFTVCRPPRKPLTYWRIGVDWQYYYAHRLAYFWMTGAWPPHQIDHKDLNGLNNRWDNLRPCTRGQNAANRPKSANNVSGLKGVHRCPEGDRFRASCGVNYLGRFDTPDEAHAAYVREAKRRYGEFARAA